MNSSLPATGALSHCSSTIAPTPLFQSVYTPMRPNDGLAADAAFLHLDVLSLRSQSMAACSSPPVACRASLHSIIGRPVLSRSDLTAAAVISAMVEFSS